MGAAISNTAYTDATWTNQLHGEWRSAEARELDRLGGAEREAVGRGESMKYKMKWLETGLVEQEKAIQDALAKDPNAGRHEIQRQVLTRALKEDQQGGGHGPANLNKYSVKQWQDMKHIDLRASALLEATKGAEGGTAQLRMRQKYLAMGLPGLPTNRRESQSGVAKENNRKLRQMKSLYRPRVSIPANWGGKQGAPDVKVSDWRMRVFHAKKTACRVVGTMGAFSALVRNRGGPSTQPQVQRIDSFSYLIPQQLGADMTGWSTDSVRVQKHLKVLRSIKRALDVASEARAQHERLQELRNKEAEDAAEAAWLRNGVRQGAEEEPEEASSRQPEQFGARRRVPLQGGLGGGAGLGKSAGAVHSRHHSGPLLSASTVGDGTDPGGPKGANTPLRPSTNQGARSRGGLSGGSTPLRTRHSVEEAGKLAWSNAPLRSTVDAPRPGLLGSSLPSAGAAFNATVPPTGARPRFATVQQQQQQLAKEGGPQKNGRSRADWSQAVNRSLKRGSGADFPPATLEEAIQREARLSQQYQEEMQQLSRPLRMLAMFTHRSNARWVEQRAWETAHVHEVSSFGRDVKGGLNSVFREQALQVLKDGKVVIQVLCGGQEQHISTQHSLDLWSTDPWEFIAALLPAKANALDKLPGVNIGLRVLMALVTAVSAIAGPEAAEKLLVVLHVHEGQEPHVFQDLMEHRHCGLKPENVVVVTQQRRKGYTYIPEQCGVLQDPESSLQDAGSGYSMLQLCWEGEANWVNEAGQPVKVMSSVFDYLIKHGGTWMVTKHIQDLSTLHPDTTFDLDSLAYTLYLHDAQAANMSADVEYVDIAGTNGTSSMQGLVLGSKPPRPQPPASGRLNTMGGMPGPHRIPASESKDQPSIKPATPLPAPLKNGVCVIKMCDLHTPKTQPLLQDAKYLQQQPSKEVITAAEGPNGKLGRRVVAATGRYIWHLPSLQGLLTSPSVFYPSLIMAQGGVVYEHFGITDLTSLAAARCVALHADGVRPRSMNSVDDVEALIRVVCAQDAAGPFRRLVGSTAALGSRSGKIQAPSGALGLKQQEEDSQADIAAKKARKFTGQRIVFLVSDNPASQLALQLAQSIFKAGKDLVMFMTIVPNSLAIPAGRSLMEKYLDAARATCVEAVAEVRVKSESLIDQLDNYVEECNADLVIMGSMVLSGGGNSLSTVMGSIALHLMKTLSRPLLIVKGNAKHANVQWDQDKLKAIVAVDHGSRPLLKYMCTKLMNPLRYDLLYLARAGATDVHAQETGISRRLLENFAEIASSHRFTPIKKPLSGTFDVDVQPVADAEKIHIIAIQAPTGRATLPDSLLKLLRATRSALLFYKGVDL